ncbi:MAG TPA: DNA topoisomerase IV subunit A [Candidatus Latescibacteria bacterium]|jgi:topoisomerase-4 subunit A|nr:DNA topoisomerase IV subunit A [Candidatus Latescibacterota bacterium]HCV24595.1 DNA topoisomerase IV subunit A [Candidatus Latescibacterota bacterium]
MAYIKQIYDRNWVEYSSYYIKERAIPHLDDGLKPVQRRILHTLYELDDERFHKVANVVGSTMKYHPHGDASIYSALVVLANKDLAIDKQGNFGNIYTGDMASAARYIECRLTDLAREVIFDKQITDYVDSYDGRNKEPVVLPVRIPLLLAQGAEGIAVAMATKILPHNLIELLEAQVAYMQDKPFQVFPDFPTGGMVDVSSYEDGNGKVLVRAKLEPTSDDKRILVKEIPYGTTTEALISSIEDAARKNKVKVASIQDYTAENVEIEIKLPRGVYAKDVVDTLYAFTDCEMSISLNLLVIDGETPRVMSVTEVLQHNVDRLVDILKAQLRIEEGSLNDRLHAKTLEQIFIENRIYKAIEEEKTSEGVIQAVFDGLEKHKKQIKREVTRDDVDILLRIPIRRISLYDIERAKKEMREIKARLKQVRHDLKEIVAFTIAYLKNLIDQQGDAFPRRTEITTFDQVDAREAAKRDLKLDYDKATGYIGYQVEGTHVAHVSLYDRVLVVRKDGSYSVMDAPDKLFVGKGMLYGGFPDKEQIFNVVYRDKSGATCLKRCCIDKYILNRGYDLVPEGGKLLKLSLDSDATVELEYKPVPRLRVLEESFKIADYPVRGLKAGGIRLSKKETKTVRVG